MTGKRDGVEAVLRPWRWKLRVGSAALATVAPTGVLVVVAITDPSLDASVFARIAALSPFVLFTGFLWRMALSRIRVLETGLEVVGLFGTTFVGWESIRSVKAGTTALTVFPLVFPVVQTTGGGPIKAWTLGGPGIFQEARSHVGDLIRRLEAARR